MTSLTIFNPRMAVPALAALLSLSLTLPAATARAEGTPPASAAAAGTDRTFAAEADALKACGSDPVVWINKKHSVYHLKTSRWYGKTKGGAYACQGDMEKAGHHLAKDERAAPAAGTSGQPASPK
jgi:hypothetical protein